MPNETQIPTLKGNSFYDAYYKEAYSNSARSPAKFGFHIGCKNRWKNEISSHRLDVYMIYLVVKGDGIQRLGSKEESISDNMLCFISPHMITSWHRKSDEDLGYFCVFSEEYFNRGHSDNQILNTLPFFQIEGKSTLTLTDGQAKYYLTLFELMHEEYVSSNEYSHSILTGFLAVIMNKAYSHSRKLDGGQNKNSYSKLRLIKEFTSLYKHDIHTIRLGQGIQVCKISVYAEKLGVSQNHLNDTVKELTGKSAGQMVREYLIKQATTCLIHSDKSISQIAYALGFNDASYFSRLYKRVTGKSPSELRLNP